MIMIVILHCRASWMRWRRSQIRRAGEPWRTPPIPAPASRPMETLRPVLQPHPRSSSPRHPSRTSAPTACELSCPQTFDCIADQRRLSGRRACLLSCWLTICHVLLTISRSVLRAHVFPIRMRGLQDTPCGGKIRAVDRSAGIVSFWRGVSGCCRHDQEVAGKASSDGARVAEPASAAGRPGMENGYTPAQQSAEPSTAPASTSGALPTPATAATPVKKLGSPTGGSGTLGPLSQLSGKRKLPKVCEDSPAKAYRCNARPA